MSDQNSRVLGKGYIFIQSKKLYKESMLGLLCGRTETEELVLASFVVQFFHHSCTVQSIAELQNGLVGKALKVHLPPNPLP